MAFLGRGIKGGIRNLIWDPENEGMDIREAVPSAGCLGHHTLQQPAAGSVADKGLSQETYVQEREGGVTASPGPLTVNPTPAR